MMKIPRYVIGKTTLSELQRERVLSPAMAARTKLAKFGAIGAAFDVGVKAVQAKQEFDERIELAEDQTEMNAIETAAKVKAKQFENDPRWRLPVQEDGTPTVDAMRKQADTDRLEVMGQISKIKNPRRREVFNQKLTSVYALYEPDIQKAIDLKKIELSTNKAFDNIEIAVAAGEFPSARKQLNDLVSAGHINEQAKDKSMAYIDQKEVQFQAEALVTMIDAAYAEDAQTGDAKYRELMADTDLPRQVRDMAIDGAEEKKAEWAKVRSQAIRELETQAILDYGDDHVRASSGAMSIKEVNASFRAGRYGKPKEPGAARYRNQLINAVIQASKKDDNVLAIRQAIESGNFITDDKPSRDALDIYQQSVLEGQEPAQQLQIIGDISRTAGTVATSVLNSLNTAGVAQEAAEANIMLYRELVADEERSPSLHLSKKAEYQLAHMSTLIDAGLGPTEAAELAWGGAHLTEIEKAERSEAWRNDGELRVDSAYDELIDSDHYEEPGFGDIDEPPVAMKFEYKAVYREAYMATGSGETAQNVADRSVKNRWVMTNLNSPDKSEYALQKFGLPGDSSKVRKALIKELEVEPAKFQTQSPDGTWHTTALEPEQLTFETFPERPEAFDPEGNQRFKIYYDGKPLSRVTEDGLQVAVAIVDRSRLEVFKQTAARLETTQRRLRKIEREEARLRALTEVNIYRSTTPLSTRKYRERLSALGKEKEALQQAMPTIDVEF